VIQEAYIQGVSTRSVDELVRAMGMTGISKSQVSRLCGEIDGKITAFLDRPLEGEWPYIWLDATYVKARRDGHVVSVAVIIAVGVNGDGRREVLGLAIGTSIGYAFAGLLVLAMLFRGRAGLRLRWSELRPRRDMIRRLLHVGLPGGGDQMSIVCCHLAYVRTINGLGSLATAAHGVGVRIESISYLPGFAFQIGLRLRDFMANFFV
jgi:hypothetical protein